MEICEDLVDPDELQLMDECNTAWVQAWKEATACSDVIKVVATSYRTPKNRYCARYLHSMKL